MGGIAALPQSHFAHSGPSRQASLVRGLPELPSRFEPATILDRGLQTGGAFAIGIEEDS